jgi:hypothetical protein
VATNTETDRRAVDYDRYKVRLRACAPCLLDRPSTVAAQLWTTADFIVEMDALRERAMEARAANGALKVWPCMTHVY